MWAVGRHSEERAVERKARFGTIIQGYTLELMWYRDSH